MDAGDEAAADGYRIAFDEAGRALDAQERSVNELRSRAGVLIAAATVSTSFLGGRVAAGGALGTWSWIAITAFALVGSCVLLVLWPRNDWQFNADAAVLIAEYVEPDPLPVHVVHRDLALHRSSSYNRNAAQLRWLFRAFRAGLVLLVIEVAAWVLSLAAGP